MQLTGRGCNTAFIPYIKAEICEQHISKDSWTLVSDTHFVQSRWSLLLRLNFDKLCLYISHPLASNLLPRMPSGVELAGVILGGIPLIIIGIDHYADGVRTIKKWWRYKRELESLARTLIIEKILFAGICERLLNELVIDDDLFVELIENPGGPLWKDERLERKLRQHLGSKYSLYQAFIEEMSSAVKELVRRLEIDDQGQVRQLRRLISYDADNPQPLSANYNEFKPQWRRVKFSISRRGYDEALTKIRKNNTLLENLVNQNKELLSKRTRKKRSGLQFRGIRRHAENLYHGLARSWTCDCESAHRTTLRLDARIPGLWAGDLDSDNEASEEALLAFKMFFLFETEKNKTSLPWLRQEAEIRVVKHGDTIKELGVPAPLENSEANSIGRESQDPLRSVKGSSGITSKLKKATKNSSIITLQGRKVVKFAETPSQAVLAVPLSTPEGHLPIQIENLCLTMRETFATVNCAERCLGYLDQADRHRLELYLTRRDQMAHHESIKSLADLLSKLNPDSTLLIAAAGYLPLARRERLELSLTVASSVLQLHDTPWLHQYWSKRDILVDMACTKKIYERAFISEEFPPPATSDISGCNLLYPFRNLTLFCLGVVLIEITLGRTLESLRTDDDPLNANGEPDMLTQLSIARRVLEMGTVSREAGLRYAKVVYRCIWSEFGVVLNTSLDNDEFRQAVYDGIITPLEEDWKFFKGFLR